MFFNIIAAFAEFEADLIWMRTREGMAITRAKGNLRGKQPKLSEKQQKMHRRMHDTGEYSISDLAEVFSVSRPTVYRMLKRRKIACRVPFRPRDRPPEGGSVAQTPKGAGGTSPGDLDRLHHTQVFVAQDMAMDDELAGESLES